MKADYKDLIEQKAEIARECEALEVTGDAAADSHGTWTVEHQGQFDQLMERAEGVQATIGRYTRSLELEKAGAKRVSSGGVTTAGHWGEPADGQDEPSVAIVTPSVYHGLRGMSELESARYAFGRQLVDVFHASTGSRVISPELQQIQAAAQGAGEKIGSDGGFHVQTDVGGMLSREVMGGELLSRVRNVPISTNSNGISFLVNAETSRATGSRFGGVQGYWVDEGTAPTATTPTSKKMSWKLNKVAALGYSTDELIEDGVAIGALFFDAFAEELRFLVEDAIMNGTGAGQPEGILTADALVSQAKETGQAATTLIKKNIDKAYARRWARGTSRSVWFYNQDIEPALEDLNQSIGTGGVPVYLPPGGLADAPNTRIKGRPAIATEYNATLGTVGDLILVDPSQYVMISRQIQQASSMHVRFTTDEMAFRVTWRTDGRLAWFSALTPFKGSNTQSPAVAIATRA